MSMAREKMEEEKEAHLILEKVLLQFRHFNQLFHPRCELRTSLDRCTVILRRDVTRSTVSFDLFDFAQIARLYRGEESLD